MDEENHSNHPRHPILRMLDRHIIYTAECPTHSTEVEEADRPQIIKRFVLNEEHIPVSIKASTCFRSSRSGCVKCFNSSLSFKISILKREPPPNKLENGLPSLPQIAPSHKTKGIGRQSHSFHSCAMRRGERGREVGVLAVVRYSSYLETVSRPGAAIRWRDWFAYVDIQEGMFRRRGDKRVVMTQCSSFPLSRYFGLLRCVNICRPSSLRSYCARPGYRFQDEEGCSFTGHHPCVS
ncbi:unnamed protein product [Onchocerca flexuosa]|uniref:Uncharacterized protein n=1 Tax=Onchocerca flexuosa TaxID=387005 RepID=A0A183H551_9BILA|nr:unnamed protein product [Onchocerca flexuosa]